MPRRAWAIFLILPATALLYLGYVWWLGAQVNFPIDDAWIHQTFARNLVQLGQFAYNPGEPSTASTSPLWTLLLTAGYLLPGGFRFWAYALGLLFLGLTAWVGYLLCRRLFPPHPRLAILAAVALLLEWRLDWAALSGMETLFFTFSCLWLIYMAVSALEGQLSWPSLALLGVAAGLTSIVRPEGMALALLALGSAAWRQKSKSGVALAAGIWLILLLPLAGYNLAVAGTPLPSTFYAKAAAYAQPLTIDFVLSYVLGALVTLAGGPLGVLLPGVAFVAYRLARTGLWERGATQEGGGEGARLSTRAQRGPARFSPAPFLFIGLWVAGLVVLYLIRLPALFHHGRYLMPLIPPLVVVGLGGLARLAEVVPFRLLTKVYGGLAVLVFLVLWVNGAVVYGWDVKFIDDEEVKTAQWLAENSPAETLVATHDIGAIGYFSGRRILDTAGLITPELAPYVRDQDKILGYLSAEQAGYLAIFPKWYPKIAADPRFEEVFGVEQPYALAAGVDNMRVYEIKW